MKKFLQDKLRTFLIALCARLKRRLFLKSKNAGYLNLGRNLIAQLAQDAMLMVIKKMSKIEKFMFLAPS
jgi:hypothetical protein